MRRTFAAMGAALAVTLGAATAVADDDPGRGSAPEPAHPAALAPAPGDGATPLALRPSKPIALAPEPAHAGVGWKLGLVALILGGGALYLRKRLPARRTADAQLTIVRRAPIGIRSELLVVNVEGQRLLLGVTAQSIQTLATLDPLDETPAEEAAPARAATPGASLSRVLGGDAQEGERGHDLAKRFAAVLQAADTGARGDAAPPAGGDDDPPIAGQARGLLALRRRG
ncbi:MAG: flagellar biosynthetic protein FliO [Myxococcales bacterium]|nr:flagellar biosynthetic protein FliO [Myxococcales bacterium]